MGFLSSILPMAAGAASTALTGNPYLGMALAGGVTAKRTGSLEKGLMAGLGAYGGGQIAGGLMGAGTAAAQNSAIANAAISPENLAATANEIGAQGASNMASSVANQAAADATKQALANPFQTMQSGLSGLGTEAGRDAFVSSMGGGAKAAMSGLAAATPMMIGQEQPYQPVGDSTMPQRLKYEQGTATPFPQPDVPGYGDLGRDFGRQNTFFPNAGYRQITPEEAKSIRGYAEGGDLNIASEYSRDLPNDLQSAYTKAQRKNDKSTMRGITQELELRQRLKNPKMYAAGGYAEGGGPVEAMSNANAVGMNTGYPQADITGHAYATPWQTPVSENVVQGTADTGVNRISGQMLAGGGMAHGISNLGGYSDGGRLLKGPGDGVSDSIPAVIGKRQPARLADGEFVVPARIVSELGNGSTEAGARKLYAMMDRVQSARSKTVGKGKVAKNSRADKYLPA